MNIKELLEHRADSANAMVELRDRIKDEDRAFTAEERATFDQASQDYDDLSSKIDDLKRAEDVEKEMRNLPGREDTVEKKSAKIDSDTAFRGWIKNQLTGSLSDNELEAVRSCGINPNAREIRAGLGSRIPKTVAEARALEVGTDSEGGYVVPVGFVKSLEEALLQYGSMRQVAEIIRTSKGDDLHWPTVNDTSNSGVLVNEEGGVASNADPAFSEVIFKAYKYSSKIIKVSSELLDDSAFDLPSFLGRAIGERLGRALNSACTTGNGSDKPNGIVTAATEFETASDSLDADDFIGIVYELDGAYAQNAAFMMNRSILGSVRKLQDENGQYLWQPSVQMGEPERLLGYPVYANSDMDSSVSAGNDIAVFGDLSKYKIREVNGIRLKRLVELYAGNDQEGFGGFMRFDGDLLDAGTDPVLKLTVASGTS